MLFDTTCSQKPYDAGSLHFLTPNRRGTKKDTKGGRDKSMLRCLTDDNLQANEYKF